jgi:hypothetical protein
MGGNWKRSQNLHGVRNIGMNGKPGLVGDLDLVNAATLNGASFTLAIPV